jgi:hypothetical protein
MSLCWMSADVGCCLIGSWRPCLLIALHAANASPWPPLAFDARFLDTFLSRLLAVLPIEAADSIIRLLNVVATARWGSACSGTESPGFVLEAIERCLRRHGTFSLKISMDDICIIIQRSSLRLDLSHRTPVGLCVCSADICHLVVVQVLHAAGSLFGTVAANFRFRHVFSAEIAVRKARFIQRTQRSAAFQLFSDMSVLSEDEPAWDSIAESFAIPDTNDIFIAVIGFSCQTASSLHTDLKTYTDVTLSGPVYFSILG